MKNLVLISQVGMNMVVSIILCLYLGVKIDEWIKTKPVFTIIMLVIGIISGTFSSYKLIMSVNKSKKGGSSGGRK